MRSVSAALGKFLVVLIAIVLAIVGAALAVVETGWAKHRIRDLIVRQANQYLTATLTIGDLEGSLLRGITLRDVAVSRDARTLIHVDEITVNYSIRELVRAILMSPEMYSPRAIGTKIKSPIEFVAIASRRSSKPTSSSVAGIARGRA